MSPAGDDRDEYCIVWETGIVKRRGVLGFVGVGVGVGEGGGDEEEWWIGVEGIEEDGGGGGGGSWDEDGDCGMLLFIVPIGCWSCTLLQFQFKTKTFTIQFPFFRYKSLFKKENTSAE